MMVAVPRPIDVDPALLYLPCRSSRFLMAIAGASRCRTSRSPICETSADPVHLPPLPEQRAIAPYPGTLDDKVELNRQMNETLEAMALALFKSWFMDFDPVRTKAKGRGLGLPKHIADLFPDGFEDSELERNSERLACANTWRSSRCKTWLRFRRRIFPRGAAGRHYC